MSGYEESVKVIGKVVDLADKALDSARDFESLLLEDFGLKELIGIIGDHFKYVREERKQRLQQRLVDKMKSRNLKSIRTIPAKIAYPVIIDGTLEEDDALQDIWANLLVTALDPEFPAMPRAALAGIIKQLDPIDAQILAHLFDTYIQNRWINFNQATLDHNMGIDKANLSLHFSINQYAFETSLDNLVRVRCIEATPWRECAAKVLIGCDKVILTPLGRILVAHCIKPEEVRKHIAEFKFL